MTTQLGYCTNVHAGPDLAGTQQNLEQYALAVKRRIRPDQAMGVGLWLAAPAARELLQTGQAERFADWLASAGLLPFTLNGFPYVDFHEQVVKHRVYHPTWWDAARLQYTLDLIDILHAILPPGMEGSISTLPIAWGRPLPPGPRLAEAGEQLRQVAQRLARLESETGRLIHLAIEPEPGCVFDRSGQIVRFFEKYLLSSDEAAVRRHLRVCHDVCHSAVMFEPQAEAWANYAAGGIQVGKVQVSSAVCVRWNQIPADQRAAAAEQLAGFNENRYLHQTCVQPHSHDEAEFYEDLAGALAMIEDPAALTGEWRVHFHVPVFLRKFGLLATSQDDILECRRLALAAGVTHFEVETYAWGVLPAELRQPDLAVGIAEEMAWFDGLC
ncbi:MAG: metabolite traffic protein EboE [Pirellulales bacterium]